MKLRHIYYRLISRDFFTMEKIQKYKMVTTDKCQRCDMKKTTKHLLWECVETKKIWKSYNEYVKNWLFPRQNSTIRRHIHHSRTKLPKYIKNKDYPRNYSSGKTNRMDNRNSRKNCKRNEQCGTVQLKVKKEPG